ncbi:uncharacterized protein LOC124891543 [Capsicum annuum]|uniref:uncharacterized protein LOC124891543 n=1 Tax=Capsicum annuum TaxID=4072 RepID=UPI001FB0B119|nr:uncharacterized protein LOC124891543 [Capsicum annuum]
MGAMNSHDEKRRRTSQREEILCMSFPLKHSSSNRNRLSDESTVDTIQQRLRFQDIIIQQPPAAGGDMQLRPCFHVYSGWDFCSTLPLCRHQSDSDSPYAIYLKTFNARTFNALSQFVRDYPNLVVLPPNDYPNLVPVQPTTNHLQERIIAGIHKNRLLFTAILSFTLGVYWSNGYPYLQTAVLGIIKWLGWASCAATRTSIFGYVLILIGMLLE